MRRLNFILWWLPLCALAQTPITLNNSNMPASGDTLRYTNVNPASLGNYTQTGTNFNWDFSNVTSTTEGLRSFKSALSTPYALFFASFTGFAEKMPDLPAGPISITDYYNFYRKPSTPQSIYMADGVGLTISGVPLPSYYTDKDELYFFPMTYPKYDSSTFRFATPATTVIPIRYNRTGHRVTKVDGWGTVTTPYGTENCLRLVTTEYGIDSIKTAFLPIGLPRDVRSYQWLTLNSKIPYFEVSGNLTLGNFTPTTARYRGYKKEVNTVGLQEIRETNPAAFPNPAKDKIRFTGLAAFDRVVFYDALGNMVKSLSTLGSAEAEADLGDLAGGLYLVRITGSAESRLLRVIRE